MNIVVLTHSGKTITRPSTTLEKNGHDLYLPDFVTRLSVSPALIVNVTRPGKSIARKFAGRYADGVTFGCLLYPENLIDGSAEGYACASCLDHSTHIGQKFFGAESAPLRLEADGKLFFETGGFGPEIVADAIAEISRFVFIRTGDLIAIELSERQEIAIPDTKEVLVKADMAGENVIDFKVIL